MPGAVRLQNQMVREGEANEKVIKVVWEEKERHSMWIRTVVGKELSQYR